MTWRKPDWTLVFVRVSVVVITILMIIISVGWPGQHHVHVVARVLGFVFVWAYMIVEAPFEVFRRKKKNTT